jgi:predicted flap endonuclease-1-like 5' DNA nuclease
MNDRRPRNDTLRNDPSARPNGRIAALFYTLSAVVAVAMGAAIILAGLGVGSPGVVDLPSAFTAVGIAIAGVAISLIIAFASMPSLIGDARRETANTIAAANAATRTEAQQSIAAASQRAAKANASLSDIFTRRAVTFEKAVGAKVDGLAAQLDQVVQGRTVDLQRQSESLQDAARAQRSLSTAIERQHAYAAKLEGLLGDLRKAQGSQGARLDQRMDAFDDYVDRHESRHSILEAAIALDTEEIATLEARIGPSAVRGEPLGDIGEIPRGAVAALAEFGIKDTERLRMANAHDLARRLRVFPGEVQSWQAIAELMRVPGIGPQYAAMLEANGIHTMADLARADPVQLEAALEAAQDDDDPAVGRRVEQWIQVAKNYVRA